MSYAQCMRWQKKHPKGTKQYMGFDACSGLAASWIKNVNIPYVQLCESKGIKPISPEAHYELSLKNKIMCGMSVENKVIYTKIMRERSQEEPNNKELNIFRI
jgi:hypothetical protein